MLNPYSITFGITVRESAKDFITKHLQPQESNYKNAIRSFRIKLSSIIEEYLEYLT